jgi:mono/diheme cytochrome c family protein
MTLRAALPAMLLLVRPLSAEGLDPKAFYLGHCAACHGVDGSGRAPGGGLLGGRHLQGSRRLASQEEDALIATILRGRGAMPGYRRQLTEAEAKRLLAEVVRPLAGRKHP